MSVRVLWGRGNYAVVARRLEPVARELVVAAEVGAGHRVLDAAAGTGNVALAASSAGADVTAYDLSGELVRQGTARSLEAGHQVGWVEADALSLPFADACFDRVLSAFGIMYAPDPARAAAEALRCLAPGGVVATTAWTSDSFSAATRRVMERVTGTASALSTEAWADRSFLQDIFAGRAVDVAERVLLTSFESAEEWWAQAKESAPPMVALREVLDENRFEELGKELIAVAARFNEGSGPELVLRQEYALATIR